MSIVNRSFIIMGDEVIKMSQRLRTDSYFKNKSVLKKFSGEKINVVDVCLEVVDRKPQKIIRIDCMRHIVNENGAIDKSYNDKQNDYFMTKIDKPKAESSGSVINATSKFYEVRLKNEFDVELSPVLVNKIVDIIFK